MATRRNEIKPVDRALADVQKQIETLERQLRTANAPVAPPSRADALKRFVKDILTPPAKQTAATAYRPNRELPDVETNPMHDLEADAIPFARHNEPDLFTHVAAHSAAPDDTLGKLLAAGSIRPPKPTLKRVQRETRNRFFLWLGAGLVALWLIIVVVR